MIEGARGWTILVSALALGVACDRNTGSQVADSAPDVLRGTEAFKDFGDYIVYVNALTTDQIPAEVARGYGISRSGNRALLTLSVHRKSDGGGTSAVDGTVTASAVNLTGQLKPITMREIREDLAIYYIGELAVNHAETLIYTVRVVPNGVTDPLSLRYQRQFYVEKGGAR